MPDPVDVDIIMDEPEAEMPEEGVVEFDESPPTTDPIPFLRQSMITLFCLGHL